MSVFPRVLFALLALGLVVPCAAAHPLDGEGCRRCDHRGVLPCGEHTGEIHELEKDVLFCSTVAACEACAGALLVDCPRCDGGPDSATIAPRQAEVARWMEKHTMAKFMGRPLPYVETELYQLLIDTGPIKINKRKRMDGHLLMHRIARDVLEVERLVAEHYKLERYTGPKEGETALEASMRRNYSSKMKMWFWSNLEDHRKVMQEFMGSGSTGDFKMLGGRPVYSAWTDHLLDTADKIRSACSHSAGHMLLSNLKKPVWVGDIGGGWFDAGLGHYYEYAVHGQSVNYCIEEATVPLDYHGGLWRAPIRKRLAKEKAGVLPKLFPKNTGAMTLPDQALCWSFYEWMVHNHQPALDKILTGLKNKQDSRSVLKEALGMTLPQAEEAWREWVKETYPTRGDALRNPKSK